MKTVGHEAILASAGSGKTFQLAQRYIRLLALGVDPERIVALTFSRKAAGEIFESIVRRLSAAALSPDEAASVARRIGEPGWDGAGFLGLLRTLLHRLHRLRIGTLDSFSVSVLRAFPFELGLGADLRMMDNGGAAARAARREVLRRIYDPSFTDADAQQQFFEAFKDATFGEEAKGLAPLLDRFIVDHYEIFQLQPDPARWGSAAAIWPRGTPWLPSDVDAAGAADVLTAVVNRSDWPEKVRTRWLTFVDQARVHGIGSAWDGPVKYLMPKLLERTEDLRSGAAEIKIERTSCRLDEAGCAAALRLAVRVVAVELTSALARTGGLARLLIAFDRVYDEQVRREGWLTFHDANVLLSRRRPSAGGSGPPDPGRLLIDERLDARLDHWLLDEFQDTSDVQWAVLKDLIDEVVQDPAGQRSFFFVGDIKQAIYAWRGGNPHLFRSILDHYQGAIDRRELSTSFRSAQPVIDCVNQVFNDLPVESLSARAVDIWRSVWVPHRVQAGAVPDAGYAALLEPPCARGEKPDAAARLTLAADLLNEIQPLARRMSVGVLVRTNPQGAAAADAFRRLCPDMPIAHEGAAGILDNPVANLLCAVVRAAFHPGDRLAWGHLAMSPLAGRVAALGKDRSDRSRALLAEVVGHGFQPFVHRWGVELDAARPLDAFGRRRWDDLWRAAGTFDETGGCDGDEFLRWVEGFSIRDPAADGAVRVMTIHQSKGLGFDLVILPELQDSRRGMAGGGEAGLVAAQAGKGEGVRWLLNLPRRDVSRHVDELAEQLEVLDQDRCFESLCTLYVALTRARRALYLITSYPGPHATTFTEAALLKTRLTGDARVTGGRCVEVAGRPASLLWETGDPGWAADRPAPPPGPASSAPSEPPPGLDLPAWTRSRSVSPSAADPRTENAGMLFQPRRYEILELGTAVHALFEQVDWVDERTDPAALVEAWRAQHGFAPAVAASAIDVFLTAMAADEIRAALRRPSGTAMLWREKRFEVVLGEEWITGAFDRVVIENAADGRPERATIQDFKTNDILTAAELRRASDHYRPQLILYRAALSRILGLAEPSIALELLFTRPARAIRLLPEKTALD